MFARCPVAYESGSCGYRTPNGLRTPVRIEPLQDLANAPRSYGDRSICGAVVEVQRVAVAADGLAAGEGDVVDVALRFVDRFRAEDPFVSAQEELGGLFEVEEGHAQSIEAAGGVGADAVVDHEPSALGLDQGWRQADFVGVPPAAAPGLEHHLVAAPAAQVGGVGDPDVCAGIGDGTMHEGEHAVDAARQQRGVFVVRLHHQAEPLEGDEIFGERE